MNPTPGLRISHRYFRVWRRNVQVYRKTWRVSFLPPLLEPLLYILAFGYGLSVLVGDVGWRGEAVPYVAFIAPALLCIAMMYNSFFETTYGSFVRMYYQKTFDAMLATPLFLEDIIAGEIVWGARSMGWTMPRCWSSLISTGSSSGVTGAPSSSNRTVPSNCWSAS